jgi:hypothetical protein
VGQVWLKTLLHNIVTVLDCSTWILLKMGVYCSQVFQQPQLTLINSTLSTLTQYLSEQSSCGSSLLHALFCTPRKRSTANKTVHDNLPQGLKDCKIQRPILYTCSTLNHTTLASTVPHNMSPLSDSNKCSGLKSQQYMLPLKQQFITIVVQQQWSHISLEMSGQRYVTYLVEYHVVTYSERVMQFVML